MRHGLEDCPFRETDPASRPQRIHWLSGWDGTGCRDQALGWRLGGMTTAAQGSVLYCLQSGLQLWATRVPSRSMGPDQAAASNGYFRPSRAFLLGVRCIPAILFVEKNNDARDRGNGKEFSACISLSGIGCCRTLLPPDMTWRAVALVVALKPRYL